MPRLSRRLQVNGPQPGPLSTSTRIRPDTFRGSNAGADAQQIAQGLARFNNALSHLAGGIMAERAKSLKRKGELAAQQYAESEKHYKQLVNDGLLRANENPHYLAGIQRESGLIAADRFGATLAQAVKERQDSAFTIEEYNQIATDTLDQFVKDNIGKENRTEAFNLGFDAKAHAVIANERMRFVAQATDKAHNKEDQLLGATTYEDVQSALDSGTDYATIGKHLGAKLDEKAQVDSSNTTGRNLAVAGAIIDLARERDDTNILKILQHIPSGTQGSKKRPHLGSISAVRKVADKARDYIASKKYQENQRADQNKKAEISASEDDIFREADHRLNQAQDPQSVDFSDLRSGLADIGKSEDWGRLHSLKQNYIDGTFTDDLSAVHDAFSRIYTIPKNDPHAFTVAQANGLLSAGKVTHQTYEKIRKALESVRSGDGKELLRNPLIIHGASDLEQRFKTEFGGYDKVQTAVRSDRASNFYKTLMGNWLLSKKGQESDFTEKMAKQADFKEEAWNVYAQRGNQIQVGQEVPSQTRTVTGEGGPRPVDWSKNMVTSWENIKSMAAEAGQIQAGKKSHPSRLFLDVLEAAGWPKDPKGFIQAQITVHTHMIAPNTTQQ